MWAKGFFYDIIVSWHYITIYQSLINNGFSPRIKIYSWSGLKAWLHNSCPIHLPCQQNKGQNSISWAVFGSFWNCKIWSALVCRPKTDYAETASQLLCKSGRFTGTKNAKRIARPKVAFTSGIPILVQMLASESIEICFIWSSSQYASNDNNAYKLNFNNGDWNNNNNYVCAVRDFTQKLFFEKYI